MQQPSKTDERLTAKIPNGVSDEFKALLERDEVEFASLRVVVSPLSESGSARGVGSRTVNNRAGGLQSNGEKLKRTKEGRTDICNFKQAPCKA
jgi:hypothetical protein